MKCVDTDIRESLLSLAVFGPLLHKLARLSTRGTEGAFHAFDLALVVLSIWSSDQHIPEQYTAARYWTSECHKGDSFENILNSYNVEHTYVKQQAHDQIVDKLADLLLETGIQILQARETVPPSDPRVQAATTSFAEALKVVHQVRPNLVTPHLERLEDFLLDVRDIDERQRLCELDEVMRRVKTLLRGRLPQELVDMILGHAGNLFQQPARVNRLEPITTPELVKAYGPWPSDKDSSNFSPAPCGHIRAPCQQDCCNRTCPRLRKVEWIGRVELSSRGVSARSFMHCHRFNRPSSDGLVQRWAPCMHRVDDCKGHFSYDDDWLGAIDMYRLGKPLNEDDEDGNDMWD